MNANLLSVDSKYTKPLTSFDSHDYTSIPMLKAINSKNEISLNTANDVHTKITNSLDILTSQINNSIQKSRSMKLSIQQLDNSIDEEINRFLNS
jgi:hypothetical protein